MMAAFYTGCASFMGQNYGAGKKERILKSYFISLAYSFGVGAIMGLMLVIFGRQFLSLFTNDPEVVKAGMYRISIMGFSYGISAFMDCTIAASRALGKSLVPTVVVIMGSCVFRIIWVYTVFAYFHTIPSLYLLYSFSWSITGLVEILYFIHVYREKVRNGMKAVQAYSGSGQFLQLSEAVAHFLPAGQQLVKDLGIGFGCAVEQDDSAWMNAA